MSTHTTPSQQMHDASEATPTVNELEYSARPPVPGSSGWLMVNRITFEGIPPLDSDFLACIDPVLREESTTMSRHGDKSPNPNREDSHGGGSGTTTAAEGSVPAKGKGTQRKRGKRGDKVRIGVTLMEDDDGSGPNFPKTSLGYAFPEAALEFIATSRHTLSTKCFDRVFFPADDKHVKDRARGHICRVRMRIGRDEDADGEPHPGPVWVPMDKACGSQKTGAAYRRHLLETHLGTPRLAENPVETGTATTAVEPVASRKRKRDDDPEYRPAAQKASKRQKTT